MKWKKELGLKTPHIIWQFIAFKHNEHQIPEIKKLAKKKNIKALLLNEKAYILFDFSILAAIINFFGIKKTKANSN